MKLCIAFCCVALLLAFGLWWFSQRCIKQAAQSLNQRLTALRADAKQHRRVQMYLDDIDASYDRLDALRADTNNDPALITERTGAFRERMLCIRCSAFNLPKPLVLSATQLLQFTGIAERAADWNAFYQAHQPQLDRYHHFA